jgi:hypothetical protein
MFLFFKFKKIKKFVEQHLAAHVVFYRLCRPVVIRHRTSAISERLIASKFCTKEQMDYFGTKNTWILGWTRIP